MRETIFRPEQYTEIEAGYYDKVYRRRRGVQWFWHDRRFRAVARALPRPCGRLLDLGCGPGTFLGHLEPPADSALGIDLAAAQIDYAQAHYARPDLDFRVADVRGADLGDEYDAAVSIEVIEHLPPAEVRPFLEATYRRLRPGGTLVLSTPNRRSLWPLLERIVSLVGPVDYRIQHLDLFDPARLAQTVAAVGFEVVAVETFFVVAPFVASISSRAAEWALGVERRLLPRLGAEILLAARRPG